MLRFEIAASSGRPPGQVEAFRAPQPVVLGRPRSLSAFSAVQQAAPTVTASPGNCRRGGTKAPGCVSKFVMPGLASPGGLHTHNRSRRQPASGDSMILPSRRDLLRLYKEHVGRAATQRVGPVRAGAIRCLRAIRSRYGITFRPGAPMKRVGRSVWCHQRKLPLVSPVFNGSAPTLFKSVITGRFVSVNASMDEVRPSGRQGLGWMHCPLNREAFVKSAADRVPDG